MILHHHYLAASWAIMDQAVRTGKPVRKRVTSGTDSEREAFLMGMYNNASQQAPQIASMIDLDGCKRLLDLGGGPGTYAIHFCMRNKSLQADVFDLETTRVFAQKNHRGHGMEARIAFIAGDYVSGEIQGRYDAVWMSHILHAEGPAACEQIIQKAVDALEPGGIILIHDFILDDGMDGPFSRRFLRSTCCRGPKRGKPIQNVSCGRCSTRVGLPGSGGWTIAAPHSPL